MCGINLVLHRDGKTASDAMLEKMNHAIAHRGPDGSGIKIFEHMGLGHTRLSIVDVAGGAQPMATANQRFHISFNGEIYNFLQLRDDLENKGYQFKTHTDTEVILALYEKHGAECVQFLRGMFAFAIIDSENKSVFLARDRLGIKPIVYYSDDNNFIASSEIKGIFASRLCEPEFNLESVRNFFNYQFSITPNTVFKHIKELPAGHTLTLEVDKQPIIDQYWDMTFPEDGAYASEEDDYWFPQFEKLLHEAAECHTIGEVPIGAYLSGGIDSSATSYLLKKHYKEKFETFSMHLTNPSANESYAFRPVAEFLNLPNTELTINDSDDFFLSNLEKAIYHLEQPQRLSVDIPYYLLAKKAHDANYKVIYTGDGADEIMAGYDCFREDTMRIWGNEIEDETDRLNYYLAEFHNEFCEEFLELAAHLHHREHQQKVIDEFGCYPCWYDFWHIMDSQTQDLFTEDFRSATDTNTQMQDLMNLIRPKMSNWHPLNRSLYIEAKTRLPNWILWKGDRINMANSIEARVPFLDHHFVEHCCELPPDLKLSEMDEKYMLKNMIIPHLPEIPGQYKKRGFYTPIKEWLFTSERIPLLQNYVSDTALEETGIFSKTAVSKILESLADLSTPTNGAENYKRMRLEWISMLVLSIQILHHQYVKKNAPCFH